MGISRRDFMKLFGIGVASLMMTRCRAAAPVVTCYVASTINDNLLSSHERLREYWLGFSDLAQRTREEASNGNYESDLVQQLITNHRNALDELVATGELTASVADLIHEAYLTAIYHVWNSNLPSTCYTPTPIGTVNYTLPSANLFVEQANILEELSMQSTIDPETLAKVQAALEQDLAYYDLSEADMQSLYEQIRQIQQQGQEVPGFEELPIEVTPDAKAAAQFIIRLLTGK